MSKPVIPEPVVPEPVKPFKLDPETLAIRSQPPRAIRFKKGAIVALVAVGSASLVAVAWTALRPSVAGHVVEQEEQALARNGAPSDTLSSLPTNYGDVPRLGPALPGDLGKPILEHQRAMAMETDIGDGERAEEAALAERKAARESGVIVSRGLAVDGGEGAAAEDPVTQPSPAAAWLTLDPDHDPNAQQRKMDFVSNLDPRGDVNPYPLMPVASPYTVSAGSVISASLITGLRSDLPGLVTAQVTERVYDSATGRILLIPQGARLIGSYDSVVAFGQSRALIVWQRIILPDGSSLRIDNVPASDASGYAGLADKVDFHSWALLKGVALSTLLGVSSKLALSGDSDLVQAIRQSTQDSVSRASDQITSRNLGIQPTIKIRPGTPVRLIVHRDIVLRPWQTARR